MFSNNYPLVTIAITSFNRKNWLKVAIESALSQNYPNLEIVISDNDSTDGTLDLLKSYQSNPRIKIFKNDYNIGMVLNFFKSITELAQGKYVTHLSSDDYFCNNNFISQAVEVFEANSNVEVVSAISLLLFESTGKKIQCEGYQYYQSTFFKQGLVSGRDCFISYSKLHPISFGACLIRASSLKSIQIDKQVGNSADIQILLQLLLLGDAYFIDEDTYVFRVHSDQASNSYFNAEKFKNNLRFVTIPYEQAIQKKYFSEQVLKEWKKDMIYPQLRFAMHHLLKANKEEYKNMYSFAKLEYPDILKKIVKEPKFILKKALKFYV